MAGDVNQRRHKVYQQLFGDRLEDKWAYADFTFDFLGATASHVLAGDAAHAVFPLVFFLLMAVSYHLWHTTGATALPFTHRGDRA